MMSFASLDSTTRPVFEASLRQLQRLLSQDQVRVHHRRYPMWLNNATMHVSSALLQNSNNKEWRFYFMLRIRYWQDAAITYPMVSQVAQAALSIALDLGRISGGEAHELMDGIRRNAHHYELAEMVTISIMNFEKVAAGEDGVRITELASRFEELTIFDEWTTGVIGGGADADRAVLTEHCFDRMGLYDGNVWRMLRCD